MSQGLKGQGPRDPGRFSAREKGVYNAVSEDRRRLLSRPVHVDAVIPAFSKQYAAVGLEMPN